MSRKLILKDLVAEHQNAPVGIDCRKPRFGWKLVSSETKGEAILDVGQVVAGQLELTLEADAGLKEYGG